MSTGVQKDNAARLSLAEIGQHPFEVQCLVLEVDVPVLANGESSVCEYFSMVAPSRNTTTRQLDRAPITAYGEYTRVSAHT